MDLVVDVASAAPKTVEVVERKGAGHPDTLCDAIAERISLSLSRAYRETCGAVLHHNVDKVLLVGGAATPAFGGGRIDEPIEIYLAGRATSAWRGKTIPIAELAVSACRDVLREKVPLLDVERDVRIVPRLRRGSSDLTGMFARGPVANDTSFGVGFAPFTDLERVVLAADAALASTGDPAIGADTKIMGVRREARIELTVACALVGRHLRGPEDYERRREAVRERALGAARRVTFLAIEAQVNAADDAARGERFLTVTGTSAESGDDGEVGRGNRASGLITPYRRMTLEATAGKNPVNHVGKLYSVVATRIAQRIAQDLHAGATCLVLGRIGSPVDDPRLVHVELDAPLDSARVGAIVRAELAVLPALTDDLLAGRATLF